MATELPKALRKTAEEELRARTIEYQSGFARSYVAQGKAEGKAEGLAEGRADESLATRRNSVSRRLYSPKNMRSMTARARRAARRQSSSRAWAGSTVSTPVPLATPAGR
ncbi:MAG: hypothetical protein JWM19_6082 [Actinomycetia bacterium]|nr:hypothetical protein [Actinomycetes bacterium]